MAFAPIALTIPQYNEDTFANWWLKAYEQGTTTPLSMATDATGGTLLAKAEIDTEGFPITAGAVRFIPFINGDYDLWCFPTEFDADHDITTNALQFADNLNADPDSGLTISAFGATLIDDADADEALSTLGFSTYGKTLIDDADAAAAMATLGMLDEDDMVSNSATLAASQQSVKAYTDNSISALKEIVILDTPVLLLSTTTPATIATAVSNTVLDTNSATSAIMNVTVQTAEAVTTPSTIAVYIGSSNAVSVSAVYQKGIARCTTLNQANSEANQVTVNLDANNDFWYITASSGNTFVETLIIYLVGYIK